MDSLLVKKQDDTKEEGIVKMGNKNDIWLPEGCKNTNDDTASNRKINWGKLSVIVAVIGIFVAIIICDFQNRQHDRELLYKLNGMPDQMKEMSEDIDDMDDSIDELKDRVRELETSAKSAVEGIYEKIAIVQKNDVIATSSSMFKKDEVIARDSEGNVYLAGDCVNEPQLLTYKEDDKEVFFWGQFNENFQWDGHCVTNVYNADGTLYGICESNFEDGKRLDYKSFVCDENDIWIYSDRVCKKDYNVGTNKTYQYHTSKVKNFTETNARVVDLLYVDSYLEKNEMVLLSEYNGNTVDGSYNDVTGKAYYISYYSDETVKTLYQGNFVDGGFNDMTGKAWQIACDRDNQALYQYYSGKFQNDEKVDKDNTDKNIVGLTQEDIEKILKEKGCKLNLEWDEQSLSKE